MARPNNEFALAWGSLAGTTEDIGWRSIPITSSVPVTMHAGRRFPGNEEALLVAFADKIIPVADKLPDGQGFSIERADPLGDGRTWLALTRKEAGSIELFSSMASDVAGALNAEHGSDESRLLRVFLGRVRSWQEFMRKGAQVLSPEAEIGLIGEIAFLLAVIEAGVQSPVAMEGWVGPLDGVQDFELGTGAVEVKATVSSNGFPAKIGSLEQLDDSVRKPLFVAGVRLLQRESGRSLPEFAASVRDAIELDSGASSMFADRLLAAGYHESQAERYPRRFVVERMRVMQVGEGFPRIVPGSVPDGIRRAIYEIDLDRAPGEVAGVVGTLERLGAL